MSVALRFLLAVLAASSSTAFAAPDFGGRSSPAAVYVNFSSTAEGIDEKTLKLAREYLTDAEVRRLVIDKTFDRRSRNGSTSLCIQFIDTLERYKFMRTVIESIRMDYQRTGTERTMVYVGMKCRQIGRAHRVTLDLKWAR